MLSASLPRRRAIRSYPYDGMRAIEGRAPAGRQRFLRRPKQHYTGDRIRRHCAARARRLMRR